MHIYIYINVCICCIHKYTCDCKHMKLIFSMLDRQHRCRERVSVPQFQQKCACSCCIDLPFRQAHVKQNKYVIPDQLYSSTNQEPCNNDNNNTTTHPTQNTPPNWSRYIACSGRCSQELFFGICARCLSITHISYYAGRRAGGGLAGRWADRRASSRRLAGTQNMC